MSHEWWSTASVAPFFSSTAQRITTPIPMPSMLALTKHILDPRCHSLVRNTHRDLLWWCDHPGIFRGLWVLLANELVHLDVLWVTLARKHPLCRGVLITDKKTQFRWNILLCLYCSRRGSLPLLKISGLLLV